MFIYHIPDMDQELEIRPRKLEVTPISPSRRRVSETITKKVLERLLNNRGKQLNSSVSKKELKP